MVMPRWLARFNRRVLNPRNVEQRTWPVLRHVGRVSGVTYRTPVGIIPVTGGVVINLVYGRRTEWLRNVLVAGGCVLESDGAEEPLTNPRVVLLDELGHLGIRRGPTERLFRITEAVRLDRTTPGSSRIAPG